METEHQVDRELARTAAAQHHQRSHAKFIALIVVLGLLLVAGIVFGAMTRWPRPPKMNRLERPW
jgi:hypothetical protein